MLKFQKSKCFGNYTRPKAIEDKDCNRSMNFIQACSDLVKTRTFCFTTPDHPVSWSGLAFFLKKIITIALSFVFDKYYLIIEIKFLCFHLRAIPPD